MVLVGLSLPPLAEEVAAATTTLPQTVSSAQPMPGWEVIAGHVLALTGLANLGRMAPALCYRREPPRERAVGPGDRIAILALHRRWDAKAMAAGMVRKP
jgi:hypothetical protein